MRIWLSLLMMLVGTAPWAQGVPGSVLLQMRGHGTCMGALVAPTQVLTAGHCVVDGHGDMISARDVTISSGPFIRGVTQINLAKGWLSTGSLGAGNVRRDLALLSLDMALPGVSQARGMTGTFAIGASGPVTCDIVGSHAGVLVTDCPAAPGDSGTPIYLSQGGDTTLVGLVALAQNDGGRRVAVGPDLRPGYERWFR